MSTRVEAQASARPLAGPRVAILVVFGGLMLLGGRAAGFLGRKRMFIIGLALFSAASLAGTPAAFFRIRRAER